jgi:DNA invertase Pin-like site-specific DNA recombinase
MRRPVAYVRVSTGGQTFESQLEALAQMGRSRGVAAPEIVAETASGRRSRPQLDRLEREAQRGRISELWVVALDRLGRSTVDVVMRLDRLARAGCAVVSLREGIDLGSASGRLQAQLLAAFAEFEAAQIAARTREGIAAARARGRRLGRPPRRFDLEKAAQLREAGWSWSRLALELRVPATVIRRALAVIPPSGESALKQS